MDPATLMNVAIDAARRGMVAGQTPFGCAISLDDRILAACHNTVWLTTDITAHAEINALREACRRTGEIHLEGAIVASTCEPCPMCISALHWARVSTVHFGTTIADATRAGFNELNVAASQLLKQGGSPVETASGCLADQCRQLFLDWKRSSQTRHY